MPVFSSVLLSVPPALTLADKLAWCRGGVEGEQDKWSKRRKVLKVRQTVESWRSSAKAKLHLFPGTGAASSSLDKYGSLPPGLSRDQSLQTSSQPTITSLWQPDVTAVLPSHPGSQTSTAHQLQEAPQACIAPLEAAFEEIGSSNQAEWHLAGPLTNSVPHEEPSGSGCSSVADTSRAAQAPFRSPTVEEEPGASMDAMCSRLSIQAGGRKFTTGDRHGAQGERASGAEQPLFHQGLTMPAMDGRSGQCTGSIVTAEGQMPRELEPLRGNRGAGILIGRAVGALHSLVPSTNAAGPPSPDQV